MQKRKRVFLCVEKLSLFAHAPPMGAFEKALNHENVDAELIRLARINPTQVKIKAAVDAKLLGLGLWQSSSSSCDVCMISPSSSRLISRCCFLLSRCKDDDDGGTGNDLLCRGAAAAASLLISTHGLYWGKTLERSKTFCLWPLLSTAAAKALGGNFYQIKQQKSVITSRWFVMT